MHRCLEINSPPLPLNSSFCDEKWGRMFCFLIKMCVKLESVVIFHVIRNFADLISVREEFKM